jgi:2-C-methyl-D-erythritol 4-phosphate cytidylyltransferase
MTTAIVLAAGRGLRLGGGLPKALRPLAGRPLLHFALATLERCDAVDSVLAVVPAEHLNAARAALSQANLLKVQDVIAGGATRQASVIAALVACPDTVEWVVVHDAARPFTTVDLFRRTIERAQACGGAIAAHPVADTIKRAHQLDIVETLPREELWHAETPQVFRRGELAAALAACARRGESVTDDARAMELAGHRVALVESDGTNFKISSPADWARARALVAGDS